MLEIPSNKMAKLHFMVIRVTSRQFAVRGMPVETIAINKRPVVPSSLLWFIMIRLIVRALFMGEPELVSRDLARSFRFVLAGKRQFNCSIRHLGTIVDRARVSRHSRDVLHVVVVDAASFYDESII